MKLGSWVCLAAFCVVFAAGCRADDGDEAGSTNSNASAGNTSSSAGADTISNAIDAAESASGLAPDYTVSLTGLDANSNGVRDDVDRLIAKRSSSQSQIQAMQQLSRTFNKVLSSNLSDPNDVLVNANAIVKAVGCINSTTGLENDKTIVSELERAVFNTPQRYRVYLRFNDAISGNTFSLDPAGTCATD